MRKSQALVAIQFLAIGYFLLTNGWLASIGLMRLIEFVGIGVGLWALITVGLKDVSVFPEPRADAILITSGPYKWIRHPMYTAVLCVCGALAFDDGSIWDAMVFVILLVNQWIKLRHEEELLLNRFPDYRTYMERTKALIPFFL